jgi:anti-anti-sigma factor
MVDLSTSPVAAPVLHVEHLKDATLVTLARPDLTGESAQEVGDRLARLAETLGGHRFVLCLDGVRCLSSSMLGKLIAFHKRAKQGGGRLTLCALTPDLSERIADMRLDKLFHICSTKEEALGSDPTTGPPGPVK